MISAKFLILTFPSPDASSVINVQLISVYVKGTNPSLLIHGNWSPLANPDYKSVAPSENQISTYPI